jgi:hypothetical protein
MAQSVKLSDDVMSLVRSEADLQSRSVAGQIAHWVKLGRAVERSPSYDHEKVLAALRGEIPTTELTPEEDAAWLQAFSEKMGEGSEEEAAFYANRTKLGLGVGLDASGNLVYADESTPG